MSSPSDDWTEFYQTNISAGIDEVDPFVRASSSNMFPTRNHVSSVAEATVVTTTIVSPTINSSTTSHQLLNNPAAGRVSKPTTRRRRASRCAPVTLLNTDTTNFRAMVQQFTGATNAPFSIGGGPQTNYNLPNLNFGLSSSSNIVRHQNPTVTTPLQPMYHYHHHQQQQRQQQQQFQMSSLNNNGVNPLEQISNNGFFMENNSSENENRGGHDGGNGYILR